MRAFLVHKFGSPAASGQVCEVQDPIPGPYDLLLEIHATPLNYVDLLTIAGTYQFKPMLPFIPGKGPAGIVRAVGASVTSFAPGDRVLAMVEYGGYAEKVLAPENQCYQLPVSMPFSAAASISLAFDTAWFALRERARYAPGESVLVLGASGAVGHAAVQLAKALGAYVLAGVFSPNKADYVRAAGADAVIDLSRPELRDSLRDQVYAHTAQRGVDIVLDPIGGEAFGAALRALAWCGRLVVIGFAAGEIPSLKANYLLLKNIEVSGLQISDYRKRQPQRVAKCFAEIFDLYRAGKLRLLPGTAYKLDDCKHALERLQDRATLGRVFLARTDAATSMIFVEEP